MTILQLTTFKAYIAAAGLLGTVISTAPAHAQTPSAELARPTVATPYSDAYVPRSMRQPKRDVAPGPAPTLLRFQSMQNLKKRFADADLDNSGTLNRDEARQAGLSVVHRRRNTAWQRRAGPARPAASGRAPARRS